jgi:hypothetical protein
MTNYTDTDTYLDELFGTTKEDLEKLNRKRVKKVKSIIKKIKKIDTDLIFLSSFDQKLLEKVVDLSNQVAFHFEKNDGLFHYVSILNNRIIYLSKLKNDAK